MNKYDAYILECVEEKGFEIGKELNKKLQAKFSITSLNARKTIQRAVTGGAIHSTHPVTFGNGQYVYLPKDRYLNKEMILKITKVYRPPLYRLISLMDENKGIISYYEALKVSGSPLDTKSKTDSLDKLIKELEHLHLVEVVSDVRGVNYLIHPSLTEEADEHTAKHFARMKMDAMFIPDILRSLQEYNIIDNIRVLYRNKITPSIGVQHNNFVWDSISYTKTTGINPERASNANSIDKQTLVVLDVVIHRPYTDHDFQGFMARVQSVFNSVKNGKRKVMPIIIFAETETKKLYNTIHQVGFMTFDVGTIYGAKVYDVIKNLKTLQLSDESTLDQSDLSNAVEETLEIIKSSGQEGNLKNLMGDLFEFIMLSVLPKLFTNSSVQHGKTISNPLNKKEGYEYDFIVTSPDYNEITIIEVKGYASNANISLGTTDKKNTVSWFFGRTLPFAKNLLNRQVGNPSIKGCYITTAGFMPDALTALSALNLSKLKPRDLDVWYSGDKLLELLEKKGLKKTKEIIERHYFKEDDSE